jgi:hypothetical protein
MEVIMEKRICLAVLAGLALLSMPDCLRAQDSDKVVIVSPRVGSVIDAAERERYELFQEIKGFDRAVFLQTPRKTYYAKIVFVGQNGRRRDTTIQYPKDTLLVLAGQIEHFEDLKAGKYHIGDQPQEIQAAENEIKPIVVSPLIGDRLDAVERETYELLPGLEGFEWATFYLNPDSSLMVKVSLLEGGIQRDTIIARYRTLRAVQSQIRQIAEGETSEEAYYTTQQDKSQTARLQKIILKDGSEMIGRVESRDSGLIRFRTLSHVSMTIPNSQVQEIEMLSGEVVGGEYRRTDPNQTRLLFAPNARSLEAGQGYFSAYEIFFPFVAVGVTDFVTLGGGMTLFPGASDQLFYLAPKVRAVHLQDFDLAGGLLYLNSTGGSSDGVGILYGVGTYGTSNAALTVGLGWGFAEGEVKDKPILLLGGEARISNSVKLITENWIPPNSDVSLLSFGIRFFGDHLAADLGFMYPAGSDISGFPFLPWLGFAYNFGGKQ